MGFSTPVVCCIVCGIRICVNVIISSSLLSEDESVSDVCAL